MTEDIWTDDQGKIDDRYFPTNIDGMSEDECERGG
jgi:hypothetical protein